MSLHFFLQFYYLVKFLKILFFFSEKKYSSLQELSKSVAFFESESKDQQQEIAPSLSSATSEKLITGLKLAIAKVNPAHTQGGKANP